MDDQSWGLSYKGTIWHNGKSQRYCEPFYNTNTKIGMLLNLYTGTLTFFKNGVNLGVAFRGKYKRVPMWSGETMRIVVLVYENDGKGALRDWGSVLEDWVMAKGPWGTGVRSLRIEWWQRGPEGLGFGPWGLSDGKGALRDWGSVLEDWVSSYLAPAKCVKILIWIFFFLRIRSLYPDFLVFFDPFYTLVLKIKILFFFFFFILREYGHLGAMGE